MRRAILQTTREDFWKNGDAESETRVRIEKKLKKKKWKKKWKKEKTGSLLIGRTPKEFDMLKRRVNQLVEAGLSAEYLCSSDLLLKEPTIMVEKKGG